MGYEQRVEIPLNLLCKLKSNNKPGTLNDEAMQQVGNLIGINLGPGCRDHRSWNDVINYLDRHHPGWRGYSIEYPSGRIG